MRTAASVAQVSKDSTHADEFTIVAPFATEAKKNRYRLPQLQTYDNTIAESKNLRHFKLPPLRLKKLLPGTAASVAQVSEDSNQANESSNIAAQATEAKENPLSAA